MRLIVVVAGVLALAWLALWGTNTGVLVASADSKIPATRECSYFIGVSVLKRLEPLAERCPLIRKVGT